MADVSELKHFSENDGLKRVRRRTVPRRMVQQHGAFRMGAIGGGTRNDILSGRARQTDTTTGGKRADTDLRRTTAPHIHGLGTV